MERRHMVELTRWRDFVVIQRLETGCIPTGYEWMMRYLDIKGVNLNTFQEDFDFGLETNSFVSIGDSINSKYPHVKTKRQEFEKGLEKVEAIRKLIEDDVPCLIALMQVEYKVIENTKYVIPKMCHAMPVIRVNDDMEMIYRVSQGKNELMKLPTSEVVWRHDNIDGGHDIAWIEK